MGMGTEMGREMEMEMGRDTVADIIKERGAEAPPFL
jgi:hypothetical protein